MVRCTHADCGWQSIAPSEAAAQSQYADHLIERHADTVETDLDPGMVEVRVGEDDEWRTMTFEQAKAFHEAIHDD